MMKPLLQLILVLSITSNLLACTNNQTQPSISNKTIPSKTLPSKIVPYKHLNKGTLSLHIFNPKNHRITDSRPAIIFFHGGGWNSGSIKQFYKQSQYLAEKGMVAISAEYRLKNKHGTTPNESVKDAKSAMRWLRSHAEELGINPNMIAAGGGSAGGQIAAATGTETSIDVNG